MNKSNLQKQIAHYVIENKERHYRLAYSYVKNVDDALDIVQESIYKAIRSMDSLKNSDNIKTWFYKIVVNTSLDFLRTRNKLVLFENEALYDNNLQTVDSYQDFDLKSALELLPDDYRSIIVLRYFEDLKIEEIAQILNQNVNTVKTHLYKSLEKLRIKMDVEIGEDL